MGGARRRLALVCALAFALNAAVTPQRVAPKVRADAGMRVIQHYDIVGAAAHDPRLTLDVIARRDPAAAAVVAAEARHVYSAERVETFDHSARLGPTLWRTPDAVISGQWREIVLRHPGDYLAHRRDVFEQLFLTPRLDRCLPVHVGVTGPPAMLAALGLSAQTDPQAQALAAYAARFYATPVFSHLAYAVLALILIVLLLARRDPADVVMAAMLVGALGFAASFFVLSVACDYRYLYALDLAAIAGLLYVALDPPRPRRKAAGARA